MRLWGLVFLFVASCIVPDPYEPPPVTAPPPIGTPPPTEYQPPPTYVAPPPPTYVAPPPPTYVAPPPPTYVAPPPPARGGFGSTVRVPADRPEAVYTAPLEAGRTYLLEVWGVFSCWGDHGDGVDAMYCYGPWRCPSPENWSQLLVDDVGLGDVARASGERLPGYSPSHTYAVYVRGTGRPLKLQIADAKGGSWGDNHGGLEVRLTPAESGPGRYVAPPPPVARPPYGAPPPVAAPAYGSTTRVPADRAEPVFTPALEPGRTYLLEVWGVFSCWGDHRDGVDAMYCYAPWRCPSPEVWSQLLVDDVGLADVAQVGGAGMPAYSPAHTYAVSVRGTGRPLKLQILDAKSGSWGDNHGALEVRLTLR